MIVKIDLETNLLQLFAHTQKFRMVFNNFAY